MRFVRFLIRVYATADPRGLAAGRIVFALVLLIDLVRRAASLRTWYTSDGLLLAAMLTARPTFRPVVSFFYGASRPAEVAVVFAVCAVVYLALLFGVFTRAAQIASLVC